MSKQEKLATRYNRRNGVKITIRDSKADQLGSDWVTTAPKRDERNGDEPKQGEKTSATDDKAAAETK